MRWTLQRKKWMNGTIVVGCQLLSLENTFINLASLWKHEPSRTWVCALALMTGLGPGQLGDQAQSHHCLLRPTFQVPTMRFKDTHYPDVFLFSALDPPCREALCESCTPLATVHALSLATWGRWTPGQKVGKAAERGPAFLQATFP